MARAVISICHYSSGTMKRNSGIKNMKESGILIAMRYGV